MRRPIRPAKPQCRAFQVHRRAEPEQHQRRGQHPGDHQHEHRRGGHGLGRQVRDVADGPHGHGGAEAQGKGEGEQPGERPLARKAERHALAQRKQSQVEPLDKQRQPGQHGVLPLRRQRAEGAELRGQGLGGLLVRIALLPRPFAGLVKVNPVETGLVRTVSATLGRDALEAGLIAGIIGLVLDRIMIIFQRLVSFDGSPTAI